jgi:hypothetical protein
VSTTTTRPPAELAADDGGQRVNEQLGTESLAVNACVKGELREEDRGDALRRAATDPARCLLALDEVRGDREVADDGRGFIVDQEYVRTPWRDVLAQPCVERGATAVEAVELVAVGERSMRWLTPP